MLALPRTVAVFRLENYLDRDRHASFLDHDYRAILDDEANAQNPDCLFRNLGPTIRGQLALGQPCLLYTSPSPRDS